MAVDDQRLGSEGKAWSFCRVPFWQVSTVSSSSLNSMHNNVHSLNQNHHTLAEHSSIVTSIVKSLLPTRRRLRLDPPNKLYFPYEPGKQVRSAIEIKNTCNYHIAFKFQTTAPKSCYMRPPGGVLDPGGSLIATVFKFVEPPENNEKPVDQRSRVKFKIMSLKVKGQMDYVPELFEEQRDRVAIEQILRVVFLDPDHSSMALEKLKQQLADAEAAMESCKNPAKNVGPKTVGEGLVIDEWKERRERYLARQQVEGVDSCV